MMSAIDQDHGAILFHAANPADEVFGRDTPFTVMAHMPLQRESS
jgi:hypothetical protein